MPPSDEGATQVKVIFSWSEASSTLTDCGAEGAVAIEAPLPAGDDPDSPRAFLAVIFAKTESVFTRLKGS